MLHKKHKVVLWGLNKNEGWFIKFDERYGDEGFQNWGSDDGFEGAGCKMDSFYTAKRHPFLILKGCLFSFSYFLLRLRNYPQRIVALFQ